MWNQWRAKGFPVAASLWAISFSWWGKDAIDAARVQIETFAEVFHGHGAALDVPAGPSLAPGRRPAVRAVFGAGGFPQGEVGGAGPVVFVGLLAVDRAGRDLAVGKPGKATVGGKGTHVVVDRSVGRAVGVAFLQEPCDQLDLLGDVGYGRGLDVRRQDGEGGAVLEKARRPCGGELGETAPLLPRSADRRVIDVSEVADMAGRDSAGLDDAAEDVLHHEGAENPDVGGTVDGGTTAVKAQRRAIHRANGEDLARQGVVEGERHENGEITRRPIKRKLLAIISHCSRRDWVRSLRVSYFKNRSGRR